MTGLLTPVVDATPAPLDIRAWRGDAFRLPLLFLGLDVQIVLDAAVGGGSTSVVTQAGDPVFVTGDTGKAAVGDGIPMGATITFVDAHRVTLSLPAEKTLSPARFKWGTATDVSNWTFTAQVRVSPDSPEPQATFSWDTTNAVDGLVIGSVSQVDMKAMPSRPARLRWDLQAQIGTDDPRTLFAGTFMPGPDTTRP